MPEKPPQRPTDQPPFAMPLRARATHARYEASIRDALTAIVGPAEAERLLAIDAGLPEEELLPLQPPNAWIRAISLMQTPEGRAKLRAMTWDEV